MPEATDLVDDLLISDAANDPHVRSQLVALRRLLTDPDAASAPGDARDGGKGDSGRRGQQAGPKSRSSTGGGVSGYARSGEPGNEYLDELRPGHPPFRTPQRIYDAASEVIAGATTPLKFARWRSLTAKAAGVSELPEYLLRVLIRFWLSQSLILKEGTRYRAASGKSFKAAVREAWSLLNPRADATAFQRSMSDDALVAASVAAAASVLPAEDFSDWES